MYKIFCRLTNWGAALKIATVYLAKDIGFWGSFLLPTSLLLTMPVILWFGRKRYVRVPPSGAILLEIFSHSSHRRRQERLLKPHRLCAQPARELIEVLPWPNGKRIFIHQDIHIRPCLQAVRPKRNAPIYHHKRLGVLLPVPTCDLG